MTTFERWILNRIIRNKVRKCDGDRGISELYQLIHDATAAEFTEDNQPTIDSYLRFIFENTQFFKIDTSTPETKHPLYLKGFKEGWRLGRNRAKTILNRAYGSLSDSKTWSEP